MGDFEKTTQQEVRERENTLVLFHSSADKWHLINGSDTGAKKKNSCTQYKKLYFIFAKCDSAVTDNFQ